MRENEKQRQIRGLIPPKTLTILKRRQVSYPPSTFLLFFLRLLFFLLFIFLAFFDALSVIAVWAFF